MSSSSSSSHHLLEDDDDIECDFLHDDTDSESSFCHSESDDQPQSINIDLTNGSPLNNDDFLCVHYNINSITSQGRLEQLTDVTSILNVDVLICTESKLDNSIPNNIISLAGYHEPIRRDRNRHGGGCLIYISEKLTFKHLTDLQSDSFEHTCVDV